MSNRDRLLQFLYDTKHVRVDYLADIKNSQTKFYMTRLDGEELLYVGYGGTGAILFCFSLRGVFKYKVTVAIDPSISKNSRRLPGRTEVVPPGEARSERPVECAGG